MFDDILGKEIQPIQETGEREKEKMDKWRSLNKKEKDVINSLNNRMKKLQSNKNDEEVLEEDKVIEEDGECDGCDQCTCGNEVREEEPVKEEPGKALKEPTIKIYMPKKPMPSV